jgi:hypothetical protein
MIRYLILNAQAAEPTVREVDLNLAAVPATLLARADEVIE